MAATMLAAESAAAHSFRPALIAASVVWASANRRAMTVAVSGKRRGCSTVGLAGQRMMTAAGVSSASTSSTVMPPDALIFREFALLAGRLFVCHNRNVVFPEPLTPIRPSRMPGPMDQERPLSSIRPPSDTLTGIHAGSAF
jgi:hypothetical protein